MMAASVYAAALSAMLGIGPFDGYSSGGYVDGGFQGGSPYISGGFGSSNGGTLAGDQLYPFDSPEPWLHGYYQHIPAYGGYQRFKPYNYKHVIPQAQTAAGWGMNRAMPYSQQFWHRYHDRASMREDSAYQNANQWTAPGQVPPGQVPPGQVRSPSNFDSQASSGNRSSRSQAGQQPQIDMATYAAEIARLRARRDFERENTERDQALHGYDWEANMERTAPLQAPSDSQLKSPIAPAAATAPYNSPSTSNGYSPAGTSQYTRQPAYSAAVYARQPYQQQQQQQQQSYSKPYSQQQGYAQPYAPRPYRATQPLPQAPQRVPVARNYWPTQQGYR